MRKILFLPLFLLLQACAPIMALPYLLPIGQNKYGACSTQYADDRYEHFPTVNFLTRPNQRTPLGTPVDPSGKPVDVNKIDLLITQTADCLGIKVNRCAMVVKIAPKVVTVPDGRQYFECNAGEYGNRCYGSNQYPNILVVTDNLAALRHELVHLLTHEGHESPVFRCDR